MHVSIFSSSDARFISNLNYYFCCRHESSKTNVACKYGGYFPLGYKAKCKQNYQMNTLKALNKKNTTIEDRTFPIPFGCECKLYKRKKPYGSHVAGFNV